MRSLPIEQYPYDRSARSHASAPPTPARRRRASRPRSQPRSSSRSTASRRCSTCARPPPVRARCPSPSPLRSAPTPTRRPSTSTTACSARCRCCRRRCSVWACRCRSARRSILEVIAMSSPNGRYDTIFVSNYALINVIDELRRTPGVGDAILFGAADYSMRIWLRPDKLAQYSLTPSDVAIADPRTEQPVRRRPLRRGAAAGQDRVHLLGLDPGPLLRSDGIREHHPAHRRVRRRAARSRTWRGSSSARATIRSTPPSTAGRRCRSASSCSPAPTPSR